MSRMPKTLWALVIVALLTGCNSYNRPTTQIGYWPDYEEEKSLNDAVLNDRINSPSNATLAGNANAPVPGASTYVAPSPQPSNIELVAPVTPVAPAAPVQEKPDPTPVFVTPGPAPAPQPIFVRPAPITPAPAPQATIYTVKRGDSLWKIAKNHYGNALRWKEIAAANPNVNPNRLQLGQKLTLPVIGRNTPIAGAAAAARPAGKAAGEDQAAFK